jgi:ferritin-like metal-binding protein YciE
MKLASMMDLYQEELRDLHSAERQITLALPKLAKQAKDPQLRQAFLDHLQQTSEQLKRLERIFAGLDKSPGRHKSRGMEGIIEEGAEIAAADGDDRVKDAALITAAQRVEHYEMAGYGCARTFALALGRTEDAELLQQTLNEEEETDQRLTDLAESLINPKAMTSA